jgi:hypothetical protein
MKEIWRCEVWRSRGPHLLLINSVLQAKNERRGENENLSEPNVEAAASYRHEQAMLLEGVPTASDVSFKNYRPKRPWRSI